MAAPAQAQPAPVQPIPSQALAGSGLSCGPGHWSRFPAAQLTREELKIYVCVSNCYSYGRG